MPAEYLSRTITALMMMARVSGSSSLLLFCVFLFNGAWQSVDLFQSSSSQLLWNTGLSVFFFLQHSGMVRRSLWS